VAQGYRISKIKSLYGFVWVRNYQMSSFEVDADYVCSYE
jgi:hypothetical protein